MADSREPYCTDRCQRPDLVEALKALWEYDAVRHIARLNCRMRSDCDCIGCKVKRLLGETP